ncbi:hypothetical protein AAFF_G00102910 [Aldrovandia affinis]|uniref:Uncharacterized protein n=1 Tax=Aldrovandia affinis TaxID=143900 RepID=A0AAD7WC44_9TELE|nr:hypothetical protein AAFF_G00102910 [Aldrovandia affinis]
MESLGNFEGLIVQLIASNQAQQVRHDQLVAAEQQQHTAVMCAELQQLITSQEAQAAANLWEKWPEGQWVSLIAPFLSGVAQSTYQDLTCGQTATYSELKEEILKRYGYTLITRAQMHDLIRLMKGWLISEPKTLGPLEQVVIDRFMCALPFDAKKLANPQSADQLMELVEGHQAAQAVLRRAERKVGSHSKTWHNEHTYPMGICLSPLLEFYSLQFPGCGLSRRLEDYNTEQVGY